MDEDMMAQDPFDWSSPEELESKFLTRVHEVIGPDVIDLSLSIEGVFAVLTGLVYSEDARSQALRTLAAFLKTHRIIDHVEVSAEFRPATDDEWFLGSADPTGIPPPTTECAPSASGTRGKAVERHPHIACDDELIAGHTITIVVDLSERAPTPQSRPIALATLEPGWEEMSVEVQVVSMAFGVGGEPGIVIVREDGGSTPAHVVATLRDDIVPGADVEVTAIFTRDGRFCGSASTRLGEVLAPTEVGSPDGPIVEPVILTNETGPTMTVTVFKTGELDLLWTWSFAWGVGANSGSRQGRVTLQRNARSFAEGLMQSCPAMMQTDLRRQMGSIGETIWEVTPTEFKAAYLHLRKSHGSGFPIQFMLDEFHIPWEMMRPPGGDHMYMTHPVARWSNTRADHPAVLPAGQKVTFVPQYPSQGTLPAAVKERDWLVANLGARIGNARKSDFLDLLAGGDAVPKTSLIHFAGHGEAGSDVATAVLHMEAGEVIGIRDVDVSDTVLGDRDRSMVVLNACEAASVTASLGWVEGWAPVMIGRGFGALVAPLWRVQDAAACDVVTAGLQSLYKDGRTLGDAFTGARSAVSTKSAAAFAFLTYGDVMATGSG